MRVSLSEVQADLQNSVYGSQAYGQAVASAEGSTWFEARDALSSWSVPLVVRQIPGTSLFDASTPYGYGGVYAAETLAEEDVARLWEATKDALSVAGVVSLFVRFPPFLPEQAARLSGTSGIEIADVSQTFVVPLSAAEDMWSAMHKRSRTAVRTAEKSGCTAEIVAGSEESVREARDLYEQTMRRVGAAERYFFPDEYYARLAALSHSMVIARVRNAGGEVVAASFLLKDARHAHYHLSGSTGTEPGANNLMIWTALQWAADNGLEGLHLGGGLTPGDSLHRFKASFGGIEVPFHVGRAVIQPERYGELVSQRALKISVNEDELARSSFFPAYRSH